MSSAAKLAANRANATLSTGPADTSRTRFNGLAHGLTSKQTVIHGEDQAEYDTFETNLRKHLAPGSPTETLLADRLIAAAWRLKRFTRVETAFFNTCIDAFLDENPESSPDDALASLFTDPAGMSRMRLFLRYQTSVQREYDSVMRQYRSLQAERANHDAELPYTNEIAEPDSQPASIRNTLQAAVGFASQASAAASPHSRAA